MWCWISQLLVLVLVQTQAGDGYPHMALQSNTLLSFSMKTFSFSWQTLTKGNDSRPLRLGLQQLTDTSTTATQGVFCVFMNCSDNVSPDEGDLRDKGMSFLPRSILTHLGRGAAGAQTRGKSKHGNTCMFKPAEQTNISKFHQTQNLLATTHIY